MTRSDTPTHEAALAQLVAPTWAPTETHIPTAQSADVLRALLPASRTEAGRAAMLEHAAAIPALVAVLRDPLSHREALGERAVRLLRNLCVRSRVAQDAARDATAHAVALRAVLAALTATDAQSRLRRPFIAFAVEFLVNFVTGNRRNADAVWAHAYPVVFDALLFCPNPAATTATAALLHNCLVAAPDRLGDMVKPWPSSSAEPGEDDTTTLVHTLVQLIRRDGEESGSGEDDNDSGNNSSTGANGTIPIINTSNATDMSFWAFSILRRLIRAGRLRDAFDALGPAVDDSSATAAFSAAQTTLLHIVDAGASRCAEVEPTSELEALTVPDDALVFFADLLETALHRRAGDALRVAASIVGSIVIVNERASKQLEAMRVRSVKAAVAGLRALHEAKGATGDGEGVGAESGGLTGAVAGLRGMLVRAIAVCVDRCRVAQDAVRLVQGIAVVMAALSYEKDVSVNPFLREWAVLAVRNLAADNAENARDMGEFELVGVQQDEELLKKTGLEAVMDEKSGRPRLRVRQPPPSGQGEEGGSA